MMRPIQDSRQNVELPIGPDVKYRDMHSGNRKGHEDLFLGKHGGLLINMPENSKCISSPTKTKTA